MRERSGVSAPEEISAVRFDTDGRIVAVNIKKMDKARIVTQPFDILPSQTDIFFIFSPV